MILLSQPPKQAQLLWYILHVFYVLVQVSRVWMAYGALPQKSPVGILLGTCSSLYQVLITVSVISMCSLLTTEFNGAGILKASPLSMYIFPSSVFI